MPRELFLVAFEVSITASEDIDIVEKLSDVVSKVENFQPDSIVVTDQNNYTEEGKFSRFWKLKKK